MIYEELSNELKEIAAYINPKSYPTEYDDISKDNAADKVKNLND